MTMPLYYAYGVLNALDDEKERQKHTDKQIVCAIRVVLDSDENKVRKKEIMNALRYMMDREDAK